MDPVPAITLVEQGLLPKGGTVTYVQEADHHMYLDNPKDLVRLILKESVSEAVAEEYINGS